MPVTPKPLEVCVVTPGPKLSIGLTHDSRDISHDIRFLRGRMVEAQFDYPVPNPTAFRLQSRTPESENVLSPCP